MVQKASSGGKSTALDKSSTSSKHASTSTEGLGNGPPIESHQYVRTIIEI